MKVWCTILTFKLVFNKGSEPDTVVELKVYRDLRNTLLHNFEAFEMISEFHAIRNTARRKHRCNRPRGWRFSRDSIRTNRNVESSSQRNFLMVLINAFKVNCESSICPSCLRWSRFVFGRDQQVACCHMETKVWRYFLISAVIYEYFRDFRHKCFYVQQQIISKG